MSEHQDPSGAGIAVLGVLAMALCCAAPALAASGVFAALAGIGVGNWLLIVAGVGVSVFGVIRWRRHRAACATPPERREPRP